MEDHNNRAYVEKLRNEVLQNLAYLDAAPGVQMHEALPDALVPRCAGGQPGGAAGGGCWGWGGCWGGCWAAGSLARCLPVAREGAGLLRQAPPPPPRHPASTPHPLCRYELEEEEQPEERIGRYVREHCIVRENELYEDDQDHYGD
jgi:hypothetical protein